ncbi:hypothetical protein ONE63_009131 [Megalurothrips usitatus]|nr:hypothetical protein ONE63_009131 [Megalurothrips usitatus]
MLPDNEPAKESKTATNPANDQAGTSSDGNSSNPTEQESGDMAEVDGGNVNNDEDSDSDADTEVGAPQDAADSSEEMDTDLDSDSDSDMSAVEESEVETTEAREAIPVALPEELAELMAGREDATDDDDVVQAILRAREKHREHPPTIEIEDGVASLSLHPEQQLIAIGTFTGDVAIYEYSNENCELKNTHELHMKAIRDIQFNKDGKCLVSSSKDKSILVTDLETGKLKNAWDEAHSSPVNTLYILDENRFVSGCEEGYVKLWDTRQKEPIFSTQVMVDIVNAIISTSDNKHIAVACGGVISTIYTNAARKGFVQSEEYEHDFTCLGTIRSDRKLIAGSAKGTMYVFNWGEIGLHTEQTAGFKQPMCSLLAVSDSCVVSGWEDGKIRANHFFPHQNLGVVGQHSFSVECLDISNDGKIVASAAAAGGHVKFWNIKYLEEMEIFCKRQKKKKYKAENNLPSSKVRNAADFFTDML